MSNVRTQPCHRPLHHLHLLVLHYQLHLVFWLSSRILPLWMEKQPRSRGWGSRPSRKPPRSHYKRPLPTGTNSTLLPPAGSSCATRRSEQNSTSTLATPYKPFIARVARRENQAANQIRLQPLSPLRRERTATTTTTPRGCLAPATCTQGSCPSTKSSSWVRAARVASSTRGRAPLWTYSFTAPHALPPVPHHPAAPLHEAPSPHLPPSSSRPAGLSAGPAAGPAPVLAPTPAPAAPPRTTGGAPSPAHLTGAPPPGKSPLTHTHKHTPPAPFGCAPVAPHPCSLNRARSWQGIQLRSVKEA